MELPPHFEQSASSFTHRPAVPLCACCGWQRSPQSSGLTRGSVYYLFSGSHLLDSFPCKWHLRDSSHRAEQSVLGESISTLSGNRVPNNSRSVPVRVYVLCSLGRAGESPAHSSDLAGYKGRAGKAAWGKRQILPCWLLGRQFTPSGLSPPGTQRKGQ